MDVNLKKNVFEKNNYKKIIDTEFNYLNKEEVVSSSLSLDEFFIEYERLFFDIPLDGTLNSHKYLIKKSTEYVGETQNTDKEDLLLEEINQLRLELLQTRQIIDDLTQ